MSIFCSLILNWFYSDKCSSLKYLLWLSCFNLKFKVLILSFIHYEKNYLSIFYIYQYWIRYNFLFLSLQCFSFLLEIILRINNFFQQTLTFQLTLDYWYQKLFNFFPRYYRLLLNYLRFKFSFQKSKVYLDWINLSH